MLKKTLLKYLIAIIVESLILVAVLFGQGYFSLTLWIDRCKILCDAFTLAGLIPILLCALVWVSNQGMFVGLGYACKWLVQTLIPFVKVTKETYAQYRERKLEHGGIRGYSFLFFSGLLFFVVALIFLILYIQIPTA